MLHDGEDVEVPPEVDASSNSTDSIFDGIENSDRSGALTSESLRGAGGRSGDTQLCDGFISIGLPVGDRADDLIRALAGVVEDGGAGTASRDLSEGVDDASSEHAQQVDGEQAGD